MTNYTKLTYNSTGLQTIINWDPNVRAVVAIQASADADYTILQGIDSASDMVASSELQNKSGNFVNGLNSNISKLQLDITALGAAGEIILEYNIVDIS